MKVTKRKAKGVLADMIANIDEDSLAKTRDEMMRITEDYCSPEVAKLLDKKGFREYCEAIYFISENGDYRWSKIDIPIRDCSTCKPAAILCPTHQMAMKWLREIHNVHIVIEYYEVDGEGFYGWIVKTGSERYHCHQAFSKYYEEAVEAALKYSLENLI